MRFIQSLACLYLGGVVSGAVSDFKLFEELFSAPEGWEVVGKPETNLIKFKITLNAADPNALERTLREVSTPSHPNYGKHLSVEEATDLMSPHPEASQAVFNWLDNAGVKASHIHKRGEWVHFAATTEQANAMMNTKFQTYRHMGKRNTDAVRTTKVELPRDLLQHVKMIHPTTRFGMMTEQASVIHKIEELGKITTVNTVNRLIEADNQQASCNSSITPKCLMDLYKIGGVSVIPEKAGRLGVAGFLNQIARYKELAKFTEQQAQWAAGANFTWEAVNGGNLDQNYQGSASEANLDIQYTIALSHPIQNHFYSTKGLGPLVPDLDQPTADDSQNEPYLEFFTWLLQQKDIPHTMTFSYGENEQSVPPSYANQVCDMIGQLGTRGTSIIFSSGDTGVGSACQTNDGKNTTRFLPTFPGACPYVTSIGGTVGVNPERAVGFSSGGFSDLWKRPWYQEKAVTSFLGVLGDKWKGLYNAGGRGFPDISAQGVNFVIVDNGIAKKISGTSASAPAIAGMIALLNAERLQTGKPALGFLNPWLYDNAATILTDIKAGGSTGCTGRDQYSGLETPVVKGASWAAVAGWDPVTGLGTPLFDQMLKTLPNATPGVAPPGPPPASDKDTSTPPQTPSQPPASTPETPPAGDTNKPTLPKDMTR